MLRSLHVRNYVLIDSLEIRFPEGLVIITGQTGAGKSILLGALGLALGGKADASLVGAHGDTCVVEAEFSVDGNAPLLALMAENDLEEGDSLLIRRTLNRTGRSRSFVNDEPVSLPVLQALSEHLIDIHSQHQTLRLGDPAFRMSLLDHYAGNQSPVIPGSTGNLDACRKAWNDLQGLRKDLSDVTDRMRRIAAEKDYNEALFARLDAAKLRDRTVRFKVRRMRRVSPSSRSFSAIRACKVAFPSTENSASTTQVSPCAPTSEASALPPRARPRAPRRMDLPAPVCPVIMTRPSGKSISRESIST